MPPATRAWTRKSAPSVGSTVVEAGLLERDRQRAEAQGVVQARPLDLVRRGGDADGDDRLAAADRLIDGWRGDHLAVKRDRSRPVDVRRREAAPDVRAALAEAELHADLVSVGGGRHAVRVDLAAVEQLADRARIEELVDVLPVRQRLRARVDELELPGRADECADLGLIGLADARNLDDDPPRSVARGLRPNLRLAHTDAGDAALNDVPCRLDLLAGDLGVVGAERLERHSHPALQVEPEDGAELGPTHVRRAAT